VSSDSGRFSFQQECEVSMWLLADGPVPFSDGVCDFLGNGPNLFGLGKSKPFMLWSGKNETRVCSTRGYLFVCGGKKGKPTASCTPVLGLWVRMRHVIPVGIYLLVVVKKHYLEIAISLIGHNGQFAGI